MSDENCLNREEVIREVTLFIYHNNLRAKDAVIAYESALVMHGMKPNVSRVDIELAPAVFKRISEMYGHDGRRVGAMGPYHEITSVISIHPAEHKKINIMAGLRVQCAGEARMCIDLRDNIDKIFKDIPSEGE